MSDTNVDPNMDPNADSNAGAGEDAAQNDLEARARRMGWRPQEEFRGDKSRWTDAATFIQRGEAELPVLRERYRTLDDRFAKIQNAFDANNGELKELRERTKEMSDVLGEFRERSKRAEEIGYSRARRDLEEQMARAVEQADANGYNRAKGELDRLNDAERAALKAERDRQTAAAKPPEKPPQQAQDPNNVQVPPEVAEWINANTWFTTDQGMAGYATARFQQIKAESPGLSIREQLDEVREDVKARFPEKFENPRRKAPSAVTSPSATTTTTTARKGPPPYQEWPQDAKDGYQRFKRMMPDYKVEEFAAIYFTGDER